MRRAALISRFRSKGTLPLPICAQFQPGTAPSTEPPSGPVGRDFSRGLASRHRRETLFEAPHGPAHGAVVNGKVPGDAGLAKAAAEIAPGPRPRSDERRGGKEWVSTGR